MPSLSRELDALIYAHGLRHIRELILARTKPSVRLVAATDSPMVCNSRSGGATALLPTPAWPHSQDRALSLLAQIDLAD